MNTAEELYKAFAVKAYVIVSHSGENEDVVMLGGWLISSSTSIADEKAQHTAVTVATASIESISNGPPQVHTHLGAVSAKDSSFSVVIAGSPTALKYAQIVGLLTLYYVKHEEFNSISTINLLGSIAVRVSDPKDLLDYIGNTLNLDYEYIGTNNRAGVIRLRSGTKIYVEVPGFFR